MPNPSKITVSTANPQSLGVSLQALQPAASFVNVGILAAIVSKIMFERFDKHHRGGGVNGPPCGKGKHLQLDQACLEVLTPSAIPADVSFYAQSHECDGCDFWKIQDHLANGTSIAVNTTYPTRWIVKKQGENGTLCESKYDQFRQYYTYGLNFTDDAKGCQIQVLQESTSAFLPVLYEFAVLFTLFAIWVALQRAYNSQRVRSMVMSWFMEQEQNNDLSLLTDNSTNSNSVVNEEQEERARRSKRRVKSLDAFRGLAIVIMIFVNYGGGGYYFFAQ